MKNKVDNPDSYENLPAKRKAVAEDISHLYAFYLKKESKTSSCTLHMVRSNDNGKTWSEPIRCVNEDKYFVTNNDRTRLYF